VVRGALGENLGQVGHFLEIRLPKLVKQPYHLCVFHSIHLTSSPQVCDLQSKCNVVTDILALRFRNLQDALSYLVPLLSHPITALYPE
jgi:hypothetical protein